MMEEATRREIEKVVWKILRDSGATGPPVLITELLEHLHLHCDFYDLQDPSILDHAKHKIKVGGKKLAKIIRKINLVAVLLPDENRIVLDANLPEMRRDWPTFHEVTHRILLWHRPYFFGDTAQTLDPVYHEMLETEANYGASALMFCGPVFTKDARDTNPCWSSIESLKKQYGKSYITTLRRYVEHGPDHPMAMLVSTPHWQQISADQKQRWRYFVCSRKFSEQLGALVPEILLREVDANVNQRVGGPTADFICSLEDDNGESHEFRCQSFYNRYDILSLFVHIRKRTGRRIIIP